MTGGALRCGQHVRLHRALLGVSDVIHRCFFFLVFSTFNFCMKFEAVAIQLWNKGSLH